MSRISKLIETEKAVAGEWGRRGNKEFLFMDTQSVLGRMKFMEMVNDNTTL